MPGERGDPSRADRASEPSRGRPGGRTTAFVLSLFIALLAAAASGGGLFLPGLYRDNAWVTAAWRGSDLVTLIVSVPLLAGALVLARRGSQRALLVWLGMLAYMLYGYGFYLFGAAFNAFFLLYVALFAFSILALVFALPTVDVERIRQSFSDRTPVRLVAGYMLLTAVGLGGAWTAMSLGFVFIGEVPQAIVVTGHPTGIVFALDLSLLVPGFALGGLWLWRRDPWGYVRAARPGRRPQPPSRRFAALRTSCR